MIVPGGRTLVLATRNRHKVQEIEALLSDLPLGRLASTADFPQVPDVVEDQPTLRGNALKKARALAQATGELSLADDTGLEVEALQGAPGVFSARYAGVDATYADNCRKLLATLAHVEEARRGARFRTVMALVDPRARRGRQTTSDAGEWTVEGMLDGRILEEMRGEGGFGYDPLFYIPSRGLTLAELGMEEKNRISHRARALVAMHELLASLLSEGA